MSSAQVGAVLGYIRKLAGTCKDEELPDNQLLERFAAHRDEAAFAALLKRHGPMVLGVCQSVLHNLHDAEDAFQAAFLLLAKKAGSIHRRESVSGWLYRVAYHLAIRSQADAARRRVHERRAATMPSADPVLDLSLREVRAILFEEIENLPEQYRSPLVLCGLEEKSREEAARLLGWSASAVKGKLERGRELLRARLRRRGLELSAGLFAAVLSTSVASAKVPANLAASTVKAALWLAAGKEPVTGLITAKVAALIQGASKTMFYSKLKVATALLLAVGLGTAGLGVLGHQALAAKQENTGQKEAAKPAAAQGEKQAPPEKDAKESITVRGRVLDPDGKPFAGAKLYLVYYSPNGLRNPERATSELIGPDIVRIGGGPNELKNPARATSGQDGRFKFTFAKSELDKTKPDNSGIQVIAVAKGHGCDWVWVGEPGEEVEATLRLVKDVPISGRVIDPDGKPVAGAKVRPTRIDAFKGEDLKAEIEDIRKGGFGTGSVKRWGGAPPGQLSVVVTSADGRFRFSGFGRERIISFQIEGPAIAYTTFEVMTRTAETFTARSPGGPRTIYGATFDYLAAASRPIRGVVRDKQTGKPIAGIGISGSTTHTTQTDKEGRYELLGCAKAKQYWVNVRPAPGQPYFTVGFQFADAPGFAPLTADIALVRGIPLRGRLTDKATGKPIAKAAVDYHPLFPSPYGNEFEAVSSATTGPDGSFALPVLPGPGVVGATVWPREVYMPALITPKEMKEFFKDSKNWTDTGNSDRSLLIASGGNTARGLAQGNYNALVLIEPAEKAEVVKQDLVLRPARTLKGRVLGPDGKPLAGVTVYGLTPAVFMGQTLEAEAFTVTGLNPKGRRQLLFYHKEKNVGFFREIPGDEPEPLTVKLQPCGSATGRIVDKDGQPLPGLALDFCRHGLLGPGGPEAKTDKDGRFRVEGLVPGQKYWLQPANRPRALRTDDITVEAGKMKDLGDIMIDLDQ